MDNYGLVLSSTGSDMPKRAGPPIQDPWGTWGPGTPKRHGHNRLNSHPVLVVLAVRIRGLGEV